MRSPVIRDAKWVDREYNREKWPAIDRAVEQIAGAESQPRLSRVLSQVARQQWSALDPTEDHDHVFGGREARVPTAAAFGAATTVVRELLLSACTRDTDLVVELGAGWAWHLLSVWVNGGPANATYVAAEYTAAGRAAGSRLAALDSTLDFRSVAFDYNQPVLEGLPKARHAVVFTQHSIEQIPYVRPELFAAMRGVADQVTCLHFEPVGWQEPEEGRLGSSKEHADQHDYNRNLLPALREEEAAGRLQIDVIRTDVVGVNPRNASSFVRWHA